MTTMETVDAQMLTVDRIERVNATLKQYEVTIKHVEDLLEGEGPRRQPPSDRHVGLEKLLRRLDDDVALIHKLWS